MSNPIQQAIEALEESGAWAPGVGRAMDILRSLQKEVEGVTVEQIRAAGGIVHSDGNIFFTNIDHFRTAVAAALGRGVVPSGWKLVPVEPTPEMRKAAADAWLDCDSKLFLNKAGAAVRAAIAISKGSA